MSWVKVEKIEEIKIGDLLRCRNSTYSQKYLDKEGYEEYNNERVGRVIDIGFTFFEIKIKDEKEGIVKYAVYPCGSSGWWEVEKEV